MQHRASCIHVSALKSTPLNGGTAGHPQQHCSIAMAFRRLGLPLAGLEPARRPKVGSAPAKERAERAAARDPQEPKARVTLAVPATGAARRSLPEFVCFWKCGECLVQKWRIWSLGNKSGIWAAASLNGKWINLNDDHGDLTYKWTCIPSSGWNPSRSFWLPPPSSVLRKPLGTRPRPLQDLISTIQNIDGTKMF